MHATEILLVTGSNEWDLDLVAEGSITTRNI